MNNRLWKKRVDVRICVFFADRIFTHVRGVTADLTEESEQFAPFSICCHTAHIVVPQFKGTLSRFKDLFKALILIGRGLFCHIKEGGRVE